MRKNRAETCGLFAISVGEHVRPARIANRTMGRKELSAAVFDRKFSIQKGLLFMLSVLAASGPTLFAADWTASHLYESDRLLGCSWRIHVLGRFSNQVPPDALAVRLEGREGLALFDEVPTTVEYLELSMGYEHVSAEQLDRIKRLPALVSLRLSVSGETNCEAFSVVSELPNLRSLTIAKLTLARADAIARCSKLECLDLYGEIDAKALEKLSGLASLRNLSISPSVWTKNLVHVVAGFQVLKSLQLIGPLIPTPLRTGQFAPDKSDWAALNKLTKLECLGIQAVYPRLDDSVVAAICRGRSMTHIDVNLLGASLSLDTVKMLASSGSLRMLRASISHNEVFDAREILSKCKNLEDLSLYIGGSGATGFDSLKALRELELTFVRGSSADTLNALPVGIKTLRVRGSVPVAALSVLATAIVKTRCETLEVSSDLGTDGSKAFQGFLTQLAQARALHSLELSLSGDSSASIGETEWNILHEIKGLTYLKLRLEDDRPRDPPGAPASEDDAQRHKFSADELRAIAGIPSLISLDISEQLVQSDATGVLRDSKLVSLSLEGVRNLSEADVKAITSSSIRDLNLQSTGIPLSVETVTSLLTPESRRLVVLGIGTSTKDWNPVLNAIKQTPHTTTVRVVSTVLDD